MKFQLGAYSDQWKKRVPQFNQKQGAYGKRERMEFPAINRRWMRVPAVPF